MVLGFVSIVLSPLLWAQVGIFRADAFSVSPIQKTLFEQETFNIHSNQKVWENPYWLALLHYKAASQLSTDLLKDWVSDIETPTFFLSPNGKLNPKAELLDNLKSAKQDAEYGCRFPARLRLLQHLYPKASLSTPKEATCVALGQWVQAFDQAQLSLVFPSQDLEQPSTVFGHLFLMVSQKAYSLNAKTAAVTASANDTSTVQYLYKGLTGGYTGTFKLQPFYQPLKEYLMVKGRDVLIPMHVLGRHLDSTNAVVKQNIQDCILLLHDNGYHLKDRPYPLHSQNDWQKLHDRSFSHPPPVANHL